MRRRVPLLLALLLTPALAWLWRAGAEDRRAPERIVTGELVDLSCYLANGARGPAHRGCAQACLGRGSPAGILTDDGQILVVLQDPRRDPLDLVQWAARRVQARGVAYAKGGLVGLVVTVIGPAPEGEAPKP